MKNSFSCSQCDSKFVTFVMGHFLTTCDISWKVFFWCASTCHRVMLACHRCHNLLSCKSCQTWTQRIPWLFPHHPLDPVQGFGYIRSHSRVAKRMFQDLSLTEHWQAGHPARRPAYWVFGPTKKNAVMGVHLPTVNGQNLQKSIWQELVKREINRIEKTKTSAHLNPLENYTRWNILVPGSAQVLEPQDTRPTRT